MNKSKFTSAVGYYTLFVIFGTLALLPMGALYLLSDCVYFLLYYVVKYRRKVAHTNLTACFPEKTEAEIGVIERQFYRNFADYVFETIKLLHISDLQMQRHMTFSGVKHIDDALSMGRDVVVYFSHTGNWEWTPSIRLHSRYASDSQVVFGQVYRPLKDKAMDRLMLRIRSRFGSFSIAKAHTLRQLLTYRRENKKFVVGFMSDQTPKRESTKLILPFFGRPTAVITGTETIARKLDTAAVYWRMTKPQRGHYHVEVIPMNTEAGDEQPSRSLTEQYFSLLEENIKSQPSLWLWTHKRWKSSPDRLTSHSSLQPKKEDSK